MELLIKHGGNSWVASNRSIEAAIKQCASRQAEAPLPARSLHCMRNVLPYTHAEFGSSPPPWEQDAEGQRRREERD